MNFAYQFSRPALALLIILSIATHPSFAAAAPAPAAVPEAYQPLYRELDQALVKAETYLAQLPLAPSSRRSPAFAMELLVANSNRGAGLLEEKTMPGVALTLQRIKQLGAGAATLSIQFPMLLGDYPRVDEYKAFYRRVAEETRRQGLKLIVEMGTFFPEKEFTQAHADYADLTIEKFTQGLAVMGAWIAREMRPDYLTILSEPDTSSRNAGLRLTPQVMRDLVNTVLPQVRREGMKVGAGAGLWSPPRYFELLARQTKLDTLDVHVYPVQAEMFTDRLARVADLARRAGKGLSVGESWLYKVAGDELGTKIAGSPQAFARDAFGFWAPLDERFVRCLGGLARRLDMEFCSFFWMRYFYGYLDYSPVLDRLPPAMIYGLVNKKCAAGILRNQPGSVGEAFREIAR